LNHALLGRIGSVRGAERTSVPASTGLGFTGTRGLVQAPSRRRALVARPRCWGSGFSSYAFGPSGRDTPRRCNRGSAEWPHAQVTIRSAGVRSPRMAPQAGQSCSTGNSDRLRLVRRGARLLGPVAGRTRPRRHRRWPATVVASIPDTFRFSTTSRRGSGQLVNMVQEMSAHIAPDGGEGPAWLRRHAVKGSFLLRDRCRQPPPPFIPRGQEPWVHG